MPNWRRASLLSALVLCSAAQARAASLDVTASYRMKADSYKNLNLDASSNDSKNDRSFLWNDARLGIAVRKIALETRGGEESTMDVALTLHALGVAGSSAAATAPFNRAGNYYPSTDLTPFIENAYLRVHHLFGKALDATFGRQTFKLGSGLLLDDDGAGLTGATVRGELPWLGLQLEGFIFEDKNPNPNVSAPNSLDLFGLSLSLPTEGTWQLNQLFERDRTTQIAYGCSFTDAAGASQLCALSKAVRSFTSARYQLNYGPMVFDGEAALEKGAATPTALQLGAGATATAPNHITYNGNAQVIRAKWKQRLYKTGEGIARVSVARGSGDKPDTRTTDEAFFPSHGHRYNGLERSGFGDFYGATPYDAWGGNYSSSTISGLRQGASGILVVGAGYTPPAWNGIVLDLDYFLYQAERIQSGPRTLGTEWDVHLRYAVMDRFTLAAGAAFFGVGTASNVSKGAAKRYFFEASGRF
jgi:hypothetical protein